jgi:hypothetical protein
LKALDIARCATNGHRAAELLDLHGITAYHIAALEIRQSVTTTITDDDTPLEPRPSQPDDDGSRSAINDPTGNAAIANLSTRRLTHRIDTAIAAYEKAGRTLTTLLLNTVRDHAAHETQVAALADDNGPGTDWCQSCYRDNRYLEPVATHRDGRTKYKGLCNWCHTFDATYRRMPPEQLLSMRHTGKRISQTDIERAFKRPQRKH